MAKNNEKAPSPAVANRRQGKKMVLQAPFFPTEMNLSVEGRIVAHRDDIKGKFAKPGEPRRALVIELAEDHETVDKKTGEVKKYEKGTAVLYDCKAGIAAVWDLPIGTELRITPNGQVDTGKGNPAWAYEVELF